ncbi:MAG: hypothetical protein RIC16_16015 [Rhodospirillales bacterium]
MDHAVTFDEIPVASLFLNPQNDRHGELDSQPTIHAWFVQELGDKILALAQDIAANGLNPTERILVKKHSKPNLYVVWEGNRRIAALKFLLEPTLVPDKSFQLRFKSLSENASVELPLSVECAVAKDQDYIDHLISLRHTGENNGVGIVNWGPLANGRFQARRQQPDRNALAIQQLDFLAAADKDRYEKLPKVPITTLQRLLHDEEVRDFLGMTIKDQMLHLLVETTESLKGQWRIVEDLAHKNIKVDDVKTKKKRAHYIRHISRTDRPNAQKATPFPIPLIPQNAPKSGKKPKKKRKAPDPFSSSRPCVVPSTNDWIVHDARTSQVFDELSNLHLERFHNAAGVLLRVFFEMSVDAYIEDVGLTVASKSGPNKSPTLSERFNACADHMADEGKLSQKQSRAIKQKFNASNSPLAIVQMHDFAHSRFTFPGPMDLNQLWNTYDPFFSAIWGVDE